MCGQGGHFAKDCCYGVRQVGASSRVASNSTPSDWTNLTSVSQQPVQLPQVGQQTGQVQQQSLPQRTELQGSPRIQRFTKVVQSKDILSLTSEAAVSMMVLCVQVISS